MTAPLHAAFSTALAADSALPADIQFMPPGRHRIRASQGGKPVSVEVAVNEATAAVLQTFLAAKLTAAAAGSDDRPFFDFNHEDREASAWPTEFYWAGDDPQSGGVRARIEWSDAGKSAVTGKTFRRFSPTFHLNASGEVTGSEINMGGLVNRAAFKQIAALFAGSRIDTAPAQPLMQNLLELLRSQSLISATATDEAEIVAQLSVSVDALHAKVAGLETSVATQARARAESLVETAVLAGRLPAKDTDARDFWVEALVRDEAKTIKALDALAVNPVLTRITPADDFKATAGSQITRQEAAFAAIRAANPTADFQTIYSKAKAENPDLFR